MTKAISFTANLSTRSATPSATQNVDLDVLFIFQDSGKKAMPPKGHYGPLVEKFRAGKSFQGQLKALQYLKFSGKQNAEDVLFLGLGSAKELTAEKMRVVGGHALVKIQAEKCSKIRVDLDELVKGVTGDFSPIQAVRAFLEGVALKNYHFPKYHGKRDEASEGAMSFTLKTTDKSLEKALKSEVDRIESLAATVKIVRDWSNEPSNVGTPEYFAKESQKYAKEYGLKCTILSEKDAQREKMRLFLGVGQGSVREGKVVVLEYTPKGVKNPKTVALVGKGVTFDSGGISIKPSARMEDMKHDMTGAATLVGATLFAASLKVPNKIVCILAFTENMPDGDAIQPGNIIQARNGKYVEILNTDAEGRLILADVLDYAHTFKPDVIVDAATLTGAVGVALGKQCCAVLGNDETVIDLLRRVGDRNHERMWQMPLFDEYLDDLKSEHADLRNVANDGYGGTIRGAMFLKQFIRPGTKWAHLDIATMANDCGHFAYMPKRGATGFYVRSVADFVAEF